MRRLACRLLFLLLANCGRDLGPGQANSLTALYIGDERIFLQEYWGMEASYLMFLPLVDDWSDPAGDLQPVLAERWVHSADFRQWTIDLRRDVTWHDGVAVTAFDIQFTRDLRLRVNGVEPSSDTPRVEVIDDYTFRIISPDPQPIPTWWVFYPKHLLEDLDPEKFYGWEFWTHPVGNGPYRFVRQVPKTMVELEANPNFYRGRPLIDRVILKFAQTPNLTELLSGNVDALTYVEPSQLRSLRDDSRFKLYYSWGNASTVIYWNHDHPCLRSARVRTALTQAINRGELAELQDYPRDIPIRDVIATDRQFRRGDYPPPLDFDPDRARQLLTEEGWIDADGDGLVEKDGRPCSLTLTVGNDERAAVYVQDQLRRVGVRIELQRVNDSILRDNLRNQDFDALLFLLAEPDQVNLGHLRMLGEDSPLGYQNPEMNRLLAQVRTTIDADQRDELYRLAQQIFLADIPVTFLLPMVSSHVVHNRIRGLDSPFPSDPVWFADRLWIDSSLGR